MLELGYNNKKEGIIKIMKEVKSALVKSVKRVVEITKDCNMSANDLNRLLFSVDKLRECVNELYEYQKFYEAMQEHASDKTKIEVFNNLTKHYSEHGYTNQELIGYHDLGEQIEARTSCCGDIPEDTETLVVRCSGCKENATLEA